MGIFASQQISLKLQNDGANMVFKMGVVGLGIVCIVGMIWAAYWLGLRHAQNKNRPQLIGPANLMYGEYRGYHFAAIAEYTGTRIYLLTYDHAYLIHRYSTILSQSGMDMYCTNYITRLSADNLISVN